MNELYQINSLLKRVPNEGAPVVCLITGSSGCGKTHLAKALAAALDQTRSEVCYFDSNGVPSLNEMVKEFGSPQKWQEITTHRWLAHIAQVKKPLAILEGSFNPHFAIEGCLLSGLTTYCIVVLTCAEKIWEERLRGPRAQEDLITTDMRNWNRFLVEETVKLGGVVVDTSASNVTENILQITQLIMPLLESKIRNT